MRYYRFFMLVDRMIQAHGSLRPGSARRYRRYLKLYETIKNKADIEDEMYGGR